MILGIDHISLQVIDREKSIDFYSKLGFATIKSVTIPEIDTTLDILMLGGAGCRIEVRSSASQVDALHHAGAAHFSNQSESSSSSSSSFAHFALKVEDLSEEMARLRGSGIEFISTPKEGKLGTFVFLKDPDGNVIEFIQTTDE
ncbi:MAG TPA: VOC family protein [Nitrososphaerales archaeon]|nr:VOC family protein [Nitrososphaerales archaeon]